MEEIHGRKYFKDPKGRSYGVEDADTFIRDDGTHIRLHGFDALETPQIRVDNNKPEFKPGDIGGIATNEAVSQVMKEGNFTNVKLLGEQGYYGRELGDVKNHEGKDLVETLYSAGIAKPNTFTSEKDYTIFREGEVYRSFFGEEAVDPYKDIRETLDKERDRQGLVFKSSALDESYFDADFHNDVLWRNPDRTLDNKPTGVLNSMGVAAGQGWDGIKEGFWGYVDAIGHTTDIEMIENLGEQGVMRARSRILDAPELILDYDQVESVSDGFQYVLNNAAMSAPYMVTTFASMAAAVPAASLLGLTSATGLSLLPNSIVYAGQTWNDMEGDKGISQFLAASLSGVGQATLERLAIPALIAPIKVFSKAGQEKIINTLVAKRKMTRAEASKAFRNALSANQADFFKGMVRFRPEDFAKFSASSLAKSGARGASTEAITEIAQEALQMSTVALMSDTTFTPEQVRNRLINAALAGGSIGGALASASNLHQQGKNKLRRALWTRYDQERLNAYQKYHLGKVQENGEILSVEQNIEAEEKLAQEEARAKVKGETLIPSTANTQLAKTDEEIINSFDPAYQEVARKVVERMAVNGLITNTIADLVKIITENFGTEAGQVAQQTAEMVRDRTVSNRMQQTEAEQKVKPENKQAEKVGGITNPNQSAKENFLNVLHNNYNKTKKGLRNFISNNNHPMEYLTAMGVGISKLFRGLERVAIKPQVAIQNDTVMDIIGRVFGALGDAVQSGMNFKEYQEELIRKAKSFINESAIVSSFVGKARAMRHTDAIAISKELIEFATENPKSDKASFVAFFSYIILQNYNKLKFQMELPDVDLIDLLNQAEKGTITQQLEEVFKLIGLSTYSPKVLAAEIGTILSVLNSEKYADPDARGQLRPLYTSQEELKELEKKFSAGIQIKKAYDYAWTQVNNRRVAENPGYTGMKYNPDAWWKVQGFNWKAAKRNPAGFKAFLVKNGYSEKEAEEIYDNIAKRGDVTISSVEESKDPNVTTTMSKYSLLNPGNKGYPWIFSERALQLSEVDGINNWTNGNLFETINKTIIDSAKYTANAKYFGEGGKKLHRMFLRIAADPQSGISDEELQQFAFYIKSSIDSANGNFNRIENPKMAAINSFLTSWAIFAGLPLSAPSSFPEFGMLFFDIKDDAMFKSASETLVKQLAGTVDKALEAEVNRAKQLLNLAKLDTRQSSVVDRLATGERDVAFARLHESFFKGVGITKITEIQRRMAGAIGLDAIKSAFKILELAPTKSKEVIVSYGNTETKIKIQVLNFERMNTIEMESYNQLVSLGIDVQRIMDLMQDLEEGLRDSVFEITDGIDVNLQPEYRLDESGNPSAQIKEPTQREKAFRQMIRRQYQRDQNLGVDVEDNFNDYLVSHFESIEEEINTAISNALYRYINERIQLPGHSNRPLVFMDPHYQLIFQFQGFISTFTANIIPKLYDRALLRGHIKMKYDTFALMVMLIVLGGASQYLKDMIKFGGPSPYLDTSGYIQRAVYASGVMGQYERIADAIKPLYPQRTKGIEGFLNAFIGESGPASRNIQNVISGTGQLLEGKVERGVNTLAKTAPIVAPATGARRSLGELAVGKNPLKDIETPDIKQFFFGDF